MIRLDEAMEILNKDIAKNISFIYFLKNNNPTFIKVIGESVVGKGISDHEWVYFSCQKKRELASLLEHCKEDKYFAVLEDWMLPIVSDKHEIDWKLSTRRYLLPDNIEFSSTSERIIELKPENAEYIYIHSKYKDFLSVEYIKDRITAGHSSGIIEDNKLIAWAITQDDGAIGFLNVLNEYRRQGYALEIVVDMINKVREAGEIPFAYIEDSNTRAVELVKKLGFTSDRLIHWIKLM